MAGKGEGVTVGLAVAVTVGSAVGVGGAGTSTASLASRAAVAVAVGGGEVGSGVGVMILMDRSQCVAGTAWTRSAILTSSVPTTMTRSRHNATSASVCRPDLRLCGDIA